MNEGTKLCASIAEKPGKFGEEFHNAGYKLLGLDFRYFPMKISASQLPNFMEIVRDNLHGCSVSMPHKVEVIKYLDELHISAREVGSVNTVLNLGNNELRGYNTDYYGAKKAIDSKLDI